MKKPKTIRAIKPNAGIRAKYRRELLALLDEMNRSVLWWIRAEYRRQEGKIAQDAGPAASLAARMKKLVACWTRRWAKSANKIAEDFVEGTRRQTARGLRQALKDAGFTVRMDKSSRTG